MKFYKKMFLSVSINSTKEFHLIGESENDFFSYLEENNYSNDISYAVLEAYSGEFEIKDIKKITALQSRSGLDSGYLIEFIGNYRNYLHNVVFDSFDEMFDFNINNYESKIVYEKQNIENDILDEFLRFDDNS